MNTCDRCAWRATIFCMNEKLMSASVQTIKNARVRSRKDWYMKTVLDQSQQLAVMELKLTIVWSSVGLLKTEQVYSIALQVVQGLANWRQSDRT